MPVSEAQRRANKKWDDANKERKRYITYRSTSRNFILKHSTLEDLNEFEELIKERRKALQK